MKYLIILSTCLMLTACSKESEFTDNKTLWDKSGCAFLARHNMGDTIFLSYSAEWSLPSCNWEETK